MNLLDIDHCILKGDPRNFVVISHWDGFQAASTKQKEVGVLEMSIVNANQGSKIVPLPLLFIPFSLIKLEQRHGDILKYFLTPLIDELVSAFLDVFMVKYCYPSELIANEIFENGRDGCKLHALLMFWAGDHPGLCKLGLLKEGGKNG
ncbi:hypothetical protein GOP47_0023938 [Adiantum capillus-veneris]|uniref:Uncharacterized protein n=1 Tax=Adiantum capillus-veneris TaxID=13818 RepID=A0A9D4Z3U0_ADICA|nr:hypothetical protein GOP47_0023938 [Adiantum capillus-veneris]